MNSYTSGSNLRRFLALLACFAAALFLFDRGIYLALRSAELHYYGDNDFERRLSRYLTGRKFSTLVFGSSRTYEGIIPARIEKCLGQKIFKETFQGKGPKYNYYFYHAYKKHAGIPKVVIYGVDYFIYSIESDIRWMSRFNLGGEAKRAGLFSSPLFLLQNKKHNDIFCNNLIADLPRVLSGAAPRNDDLFDDINNYPGAPTLPDHPLLITEKPPEHLFQDMPLPPGTEGKYFNRLLKELRADGVRVALVSLPDYYGSYKTNRQLRFFHDHLRDLSNRYRNITPLIYNTPDQFPLHLASFFMDGGWGKTNSHLSRLGAIMLAKKLCRDLLPLYQ